MCDQEQSSQQYKLTDSLSPLMQGHYIAINRVIQEQRNFTKRTSNDSN